MCTCKPTPLYRCNTLRAEGVHPVRRRPSTSAPAPRTVLGIHQCTSTFVARARTVPTARQNVHKNALRTGKPDTGYFCTCLRDTVSPPLASCTKTLVTSQFQGNGGFEGVVLRPVRSRPGKDPSDVPKSVQYHTCTRQKWDSICNSGVIVLGQRSNMEETG